MLYFCCFNSPECSGISKNGILFTLQENLYAEEIHNKDVCKRNTGNHTWHKNSRL